MIKLTKEQRRKLCEDWQNSDGLHGDLILAVEAEVLRLNGVGGKALITVESSLRFRLQCEEEKSAGLLDEVRELKSRIEQLKAAPQPQQAAPGAVLEGRLWLWKNFVNGRPEYWAFDNPYPVHMDCGDPQTLGEPCGYAIFKPSRNSRPDVPEERVLAAMLSAAPKPQQMTPIQVRDGIADWIETNIKHREFWTPEVVELIRAIEINGAKT